MKQILVLTLLVVGVAVFVMSQTDDKKAAQSGSAEQEVRELTRKWDEAQAQRDTATLAGILADGFVLTDASGAVLDKSQYLTTLFKAPDMTQQSFTTEDLSVRVYGDAAVVTGRSSWKGRPRGKGQFVNAQYRFTDVWVRRQGNWQAVATQGTALAQ
jgi:ketosteroid isomerase-like protein